MDEMKCPKCENAMEEGFAKYKYGAGPTVGNAIEWVAGKLPGAGTRFWSLGLSQRRLPITAYRCVNCGYLEFYATEDWKEKPKRG